MAEKEWDSLAFIMAYEDGELDDDAIIEGFQHLVDNGMAWTLQGSYGRMAQHLINQGLIRNRTTTFKARED